MSNSAELTGNSTERDEILFFNLKTLVILKKNRSLIAQTFHELIKNAWCHLKLLLND